MFSRKELAHLLTDGSLYVLRRLIRECDLETVSGMGNRKRLSFVEAEILFDTYGRPEQIKLLKQLLIRKVSGKRTITDGPLGTVSSKPFTTTKSF